MVNYSAELNNLVFNSDVQCKKLNIYLAEINLYSKITFFVFVILQILRYWVQHWILKSGESDAQKIRLLLMSDMIDWISYPFLMYSVLTILNILR